MGSPFVAPLTFYHIFTMTQNPKLVVKLCKNSTIYDFPINVLHLRSQGKNFKPFGLQRSDLDMGQKYSLEL